MNMSFMYTDQSHFTLHEYLMRLMIVSSKREDIKIDRCLIRLPTYLEALH